VDDLDDPAGRKTRSFWHHFPNDDAWKRCTLTYMERECFEIEPCCRNCWHRGEQMTPRKAAAWAGVDLETPIILLAARLVCSRCGYPAGYFHLHNPAVKAHK
jgi:hypothetical protein